MPIRTPFKDILEGGHEFYILERRRRKEGPPGTPASKMKAVSKKESDWSYTGSDTLRYRLYGELGHPEDQMHDVWSVTGYDGWWSLDFALNALQRAREADKRGAFDYRNGHNKVTRAIRYHWRLVKVRLAKETEVVDEKSAVTT